MTLTEQLKFLDIYAKRLNVFAVFLQAVNIMGPSNKKLPLKQSCMDNSKSLSVLTVDESWRIFQPNVFFS